MKINENIAYAKSILVKNGITEDSDEYLDYLKIKDICGKSQGYVGIMTKLRFIDRITDMDEIISIFDILRNSKIDINKLNKLSYSEILEMFYDEFDSDKLDNKDIELYYKDEQYSYYKVHTYKGILKIGSPSWCLKTKSNWDSYMSKYDTQWVIIDNRYKNRILSPDNNYLNNYSNTQKPWIRYGFSTKLKEDSISWVGNDDNNNLCKLNPESWTTFGVICTIFNLCSGIKKSYYELFNGCESIKGTKWHRVVDISRFCSWARQDIGIFNQNDKIFVSFSRSYSMLPYIVIMRDTNLFLFYLTKSDETHNLSFIKPGSMDCTDKGVIFKVISDELKKGTNDIFYTGLELKLGLTTIEDVKKHKQFIKQVGDWIVFHRNKNYYLIVNSNIQNSIEIESYNLVSRRCETDNPIGWYLDKESMIPHGNVRIKDYHKLIIDSFKKTHSEPKSIEKDKKVKGFWDFLKK